MIEFAGVRYRKRRLYNIVYLNPGTARQQWNKGTVSLDGVQRHRLVTKILQSKRSWLSLRSFQ